MVIEKVSIPDEEKIPLIHSIGKKMKSIFAYRETAFTTDIVDSVWYLGVSCEEGEFQIEREDINAKLFDGIEDGGRIKISTTPVSGLKIESRKTINRIVRGVSIVHDTFEFKQGRYKITYPQSILFHFDDCNLVVERYWLFSLEGLVVHLEPLDAENFGLCDELSFWYEPDDPEVFPEKPIFTQTIERL